jgi:hypothetical protein
MFYVLHSTLLHLPPLKFSTGIGECWDRTHDCSDFGIGCQTQWTFTALVFTSPAPYLPGAPAPSVT